MALVKHVQNLGLRPSPAPVSALSLTATRCNRDTDTRQRPESSLIRPPQDRVFYLAPVPQGLGILSPTPEHPLPAIPIPIHVHSPLTPSPQPAPTPSRLPTMIPHPTPQVQANQVQAILPTSAANPYITQSTLPIALSRHTNNNCNSDRSALQRLLSSASANLRFETAALTPLPLQTAEELVLINAGVEVGAVMTEMEIREVSGGFGRLPLEVSSGVAVTEEAVGLHAADLITRGT